MADPSGKRAAFRKLHEAGCFVMPNPWDIGSARHLQHAGFKALASTSAGYAWTLGLADGGLDRGQVLAHLTQMSAAIDLPLNADFEAGYADSPEGVAESVRLCVATGVSGLSIEDFTGDRARGLHDLEVAVARLRAARAAIDASGEDVVLTGRAEGLIRGRPDLDDVIGRLRAYAAAGADCLYAPGLADRDQIAVVVRAVAPKPVNVLMGGPGDLTVADLAALGVRRISVGGALARAAWGGFLRAARLIADEGSFQGLAEAVPSGEIVAGFKPAR